MNVTGLHNFSGNTIKLEMYSVHSDLSLLAKSKMFKELARYKTKCKDCIQLTGVASGMPAATKGFIGCIRCVE